MKIFSLLLISFLNMGFSQSLVFFNNQDTITFKENELIKINGQKYLYQKAIKNKTQIHLIESGLFKKEHITLDTSKIETFRKYKRFKIFNSLKTASFGFLTGTFTGGLIGFLGGYNGGFAKVDSDRLTVGVLFGLFFGASSGAALGTGGLVYGFISFGEDSLSYSQKYTLKFDYRN